MTTGPEPQLPGHPSRLQEPPVPQPLQYCPVISLEHPPLALLYPLKSNSPWSFFFSGCVASLAVLLSSVRSVFLGPTLNFHPKLALGSIQLLHVM